jgi:hypothetical protein
MHFIPIWVFRNQLLCHPAISLLLYLNQMLFLLIWTYETLVIGKVNQKSASFLIKPAV